MRLNRITKHDVKRGDVLRFTSGDSWLVVNIIPSGNYALCFTIQSMKTRQTIYAYPSSQLYGAEIIPAD